MPKHVLMLVIATIWIITGSACTTIKTVYVPQPLDLPERPVLPAINEAEFKDLPADVYQRVEERDRKRRQYAEELEVIILSTQKQKKGN